MIGAKYDGMFKLVSAQDPEQGNVPIPGDFNLVIRPEGETRYAISFRIGNSLRGEMAVTEGVDGAPDSLHVGDIMSTSESSFLFRQRDCFDSVLFVNFYGITAV